MVIVAKVSPAVALKAKPTEPSTSGSVSTDTGPELAPESVVAVKVLVP